jgi:hypothetical protein
MTVQLYEGCWGVTQSRERRGPIGLTKNDGLCNSHPFCDPDRFTYGEDGSYGMKVGVSSPNDIIAVFATEAEADAYLAQESHKPLGQIVREEYDRLRAKDLSGVKHAVNAPSFTFAPAPKPVTWPDGVTKMTIGPHQITIDAETGVIQVVWHGSVGSTPAQARQLAALLLAAADKAEGRG